MHELIKNRLNRKYPQFLAQRMGRIYFILLIPTLTFFLILLEPFGLGYWYEYHKWLVLFGYSITCTGTYLFVYLIRSSYHKEYTHPENWTVGKELQLLLFYLPLLAFSTWFYAIASVQEIEFSLESFFKMQNYNSRVGLIAIPSFGYFINSKLKHSHPEDQGLFSENEPVKAKPNLPETITICNIPFVINDICYVEIKTNDLHFWVLRNGELIEIITRYTMKKLENDLKLYSQFLRCQISFIVNMNHLKDWDITDDKMVIHPKYCTVEISISREKSDEIKEILRKNYIFKAK